MKGLHRLLIILLVVIHILPQELFAVRIHDEITELEALREAYSIERNSKDTMFLEKQVFEAKNEKSVEVTKGDSDILGSNYVVRKKSSFSNLVHNRIVKSELREQTMIFNNARESIDPTTLSIEPIVGVEKMKIEQEVRSKRGKDANVVTFDFGIQDTHLIFSTPVKLSVDA